MGLLQRLDDLDTRVIGHGDPNWNSPTPRPWNPELGPLTPARGSHLPYAWVLSPTGVVAYGLLIAFHGQSSYLEIVIRYAPFPLLMFVICLRTLGRFLQAAAPLPSDAPIDRSGPARWAPAIGIAAVLLAFVLLEVAVKRDAATISLAPVYLLAGGLYFATAERQIARWEETHDVEVLRARYGWRGHRGFYVRPR